MSRSHWLHRHFGLFYFLWIVACALLFLILQRIDLDDPVNPRDRISSDRAGEIALSLVRRQNAAAYAYYHVVNVAWARPREAGPDPRWIVLLDTKQRSGLDQAVVVELEPLSGRVIRIREVFRD